MSNKDDSTNGQLESEVLHHVDMQASTKSKNRTLQQKLECLRKAINNSKEHRDAHDPSRIYSQYIRYALDQFVNLNFKTSKAAKGLKRKDVVHEHVIPHSIVMNMLFDLSELTDEKMLSVLKPFFIICAITKEEDKRLTDAGFRRKMPPNWTVKDSVFARYEDKRVNIEV